MSPYCIFACLWFSNVKMNLIFCQLKRFLDFRSLFIWALVNCDMNLSEIFTFYRTMKMCINEINWRSYFKKTISAGLKGCSEKFGQHAQARFKTKYRDTQKPQRAPAAQLTSRLLFCMLNVFHTFRALRQPVTTSSPNVITQFTGRNNVKHSERTALYYTVGLIGGFSFVTLLESTLTVVTHISRQKKLTCYVSRPSSGHHHLQLGQVSVSLGILHPTELQVSIDEVGELDHNSRPVDWVEAHEAMRLDQLLVCKQTAQGLVYIIRAAVSCRGKDTLNVTAGKLLQE